MAEIHWRGELHAHGWQRVGMAVSRAGYTWSDYQRGTEMLYLVERTSETADEVVSASYLRSVPDAREWRVCTPDTVLAIVTAPVVAPYRSRAWESLFGAWSRRESAGGA